MSAAAATVLDALLGGVVLGSGVLIAHSYVAFPLLLRALARGRRLPKLTYAPDAPELPAIDVLLAVHNEQQVLEEKVRRTFATTYPAGKLRLLVGSDNSTDGTNALLAQLAQEFPTLDYQVFTQRQGKPGVMQHLSARATAPLLVLTDANVFFEPDTLYELARHFRRPAVGLVAANVAAPPARPGEPAAGIVAQERAYLARENQLKYREGVVWGAAIGAHGGAFAVRRAAYVPAPAGFVVDDFFISQSVLQAGYQTLLEPAARATEDVGDHLPEEFRRKARIAVGNFQNLREFGALLWPPWRGAAFAYWSHKVLRWLTPQLLLLALAANVTLLARGGGWWWQATLAAQLVLPLLALLDWLTGRNWRGPRYARHFYAMNAALLVGWVRYLRGQRSAVWQPTLRNQVK